MVPVALVGLLVAACGDSGKQPAPKVGAAIAAKAVAEARVDRG